MRKIEITNYSYGFSSSSSVNRVILSLFNQDQMVCVIFFYDKKSTQFPFMAGNGIVLLEYDISWLDNIVDMLRNEKPVYFFINSNGSYYLSTEEEPVGEEELQQ